MTNKFFTFANQWEFFDSTKPFQSNVGVSD